MRRISTIALFIICSAAAIFAGGAGEKETPSEGLDIFVSILPQTYLVESIGGDRVSVDVMVAPGKSPATYEPTPRQVTALGSADGFITIGVAFEEAFLPVIESNLPDLPIIAGDAGIRKRMIEEHDHDEEDHEAEDEHHEEEGGLEEDEHHEEPDPHIWMDPNLMMIQAQTIRDALIELDPAGASVYREGYETVLQELEELDGLLKERLEPLSGSTLFVYHPAFGYFADRYGMRQVAIETGGNEPTPAQLEALIEEAIEDGVSMIFVQPEFPVKSAQAVADAIGGSVIPVAPLRADYIENLEGLAKALIEEAD